MQKNTDGALTAAAKAGYIAKGIIYLLIGGLAFGSIFGSSSAGGGQEAVKTLGEQPFGQFMLIVLGVGLFAYALWRIVQGALDPEGKGTDATGGAKRVGYVASGLMHAFLGLTAFQMALGSSSGGSSKKTYLAKLMNQPFGQWLVGALGLFVIGYALRQIYKAYTTDFTKELKTQEMSGSERTWYVRIARLGLAARGTVFTIVGVYLVKAAISSNAGEAKGVGEALREISSQSYGAILLSVVALGLLCYGIYQFICARYRKIPHANVNVPRPAALR